MDGEELLSSLQRDADTKIRAIWTETEAEAARLQAEQAAATAALLSACREQTSGDIKRRKEDVIARAQQEAARLRRAAEQDLAARLLPLAQKSLYAIGDSDAGDLIEGLSREVPSLSWEQVRVNPRDEERARGLFSGAVIVADDRIAGGLDATTADTSIRVVNTLEKRLQNAWEEILPELMTKCYGTLQGD